MTSATVHHSLTAQHIPGTSGFAGLTAPPLPRLQNFTAEQAAQLVRRARLGDQDAFREIVERYQAKVFSIIRGVLGNRDEAEDIAQSVFTKVYFHLATFNFRCAPVTWIYRITVNQCFDYLRRQKTRKLVYESELRKEDVQRIEPLPSYNAAKAVQRRLEQREIVVKLLASLSEEERCLLLMKEVEGYPVTELAALASMNLNTLKVKLHRARLKMLKEARRAGFVVD